MTGKQRAVLWLGLILVALNLVSKWAEVKGVIFKGNPIGGNKPNIGGLPGFGLGTIPFLTSHGTPQATPPKNQTIMA